MTTRDRIAKRIQKEWQHIMLASGGRLGGELVADAVLDELGWDDAPRAHITIHYTSGDQAVAPGVYALIREVDPE